MSYNVGCGFGRDGDVTLHFAPMKYVENMEEFYCRMFGSNPKQICMLPLEKGDYHEAYASKYLVQDGIQKYQSLIGAR